MSTIEINNVELKKVGELAIDDSITTGKVNKAVLHAAVRRVLAGKHHGTVRTKTRSEVDRSTKKIFKQKGTGNARHGSRKSSPFVGGGRVFGPKPRDYSLDMNKKVRKLAFREALKLQIQLGSVTVLDQLPLTEIKTKMAAQIFAKMGVTRGLVVIEKATDVLVKSIRNLKNFKVVPAQDLSLYDLVKFPKVIFTSKAFEEVSKRCLLN
ncbi:MAG: 50S ribosomal protein L4 [uncultured bacterium]|nr:MAG: 50S ribosomal protein L4 [uncultured bacterium]